MFDDHGGWKEAEEAYRELKRDPIIEPRLGVISHGNDKKIAPLQMADLMAFETRYKCKEWKCGSGIERHTYKQLIKSLSVFYIGILTKETLINQMADWPDI